MITREQAAERLRISGVTTASPEITTDVVLAIIDNTARASAHAAATVYSVGDKILTATINGRLYSCVVAGTSGATAPSWPLAGRGMLGMRVADGTVTWQDVGAAHAEQYDLNAAARECWLYRANMLSQKFDTSSDGESMKRSQMYDHAVAQARRYGWRGAL